MSLNTNSTHPVISIFQTQLQQSKYKYNRKKSRGNVKLKGDNQHYCYVDSDKLFIELRHPSPTSSMLNLRPSELCLFIYTFNPDNTIVNTDI